MIVTIVTSWESMGKSCYIPIRSPIKSPLVKSLSNLFPPWKELASTQASSASRSSPPLPWCDTSLEHLRALCHGGNQSRKTIKQGHLIWFTATWFSLYIHIMNKRYVKLYIYIHNYVIYKILIYIIIIYIYI